MAQPAPINTARSWIKKGCAPIPIPYGSKGPAIKGWTKLRITGETATDYFNADQLNVGVLMGAPSDWLIDIDLDTPEAVDVAPIFFPSTCSFGRRTRPRSHLLYRSPGTDTKKYAYAGTMLLEVRSTGTQTVVPGSFHSGEYIEFTADTPPAVTIDNGSLIAAAGKTAAASLLARTWRDMSGGRHETVLALSGALLHSCWIGEDVLQFVGAVISIAGDEEAKDRIRAVQDTIDKYSRKEQTSGWPTLAEYLDEDVIRKVREWLDIKDDASYGLIIPGASSVATNEWPDPIPLTRKLPPAEPFPLEVLGDILMPTAKVLVDAVQAPDALCAQSLLAGATQAVQPYADIEIDGRTFPISNYFVSLAETGERKTATDQIALAPHRKFQRSLLENHGEQLAEYQADQAAWKKAREQALSASRNDTRDKKREALLELGAEPQPPIYPVLITEEPTYEGLVKALINGWPAMGIFSDEGGRFLGGCGMNAENMLKTAAGLSSLWSGTPVSRTRGGDGNIVLYGRRLSMHLMVQPTVSGLLFNNETLIGQGLLSRCLSAYPNTKIGERPYNTSSLYDSPAVTQYFARIMSALETPLPLVEGTQNELSPRSLTLSSEAKQDWIAFHDHIERLCKEGKELHRIRGIAAKTAEHALRIAGVLALLDDINVSSIAVQYIDSAIELTQFYLGEALRLLETTSDDLDLTLAEKLLGWLKQRNYQEVPLQQIYQYGPFSIRNKDTAIRMLRILCEHGWVRPAGKSNVWEVRNDTTTV